MPAPATASEAFAQRLLTGDAIIALVDAKVYPTKPTQDIDGDYIVYYRTAGGDNKTLDGRSGLQAHDIRVECYSGTSAGAVALLNAVVDRVCGSGNDRWRDRDNGVQGCFAQGDSDEQILDDGTQIASQTFSLWFKPQ